MFDVIKKLFKYEAKPKIKAKKRAIAKNVDLDDIRKRLKTMHPSQKLKASLFIFDAKLQNLTVLEAREVFLRCLPQLGPDGKTQGSSQFGEVVVPSGLGSEARMWEVKDTEVLEMDDEKFLRYVDESFRSKEHLGCFCYIFFVFCMEMMFCIIVRFIYF